jgi:hypothetical protein
MRIGGELCPRDVRWSPFSFSAIGVATMLLPRA